MAVTFGFTGKSWAWPNGFGITVDDLLTDSAQELFVGIDGGKMVYIGARTTGRLSIGDATECPPTLGICIGAAVF